MPKNRPSTALVTLLLLAALPAGAVAGAAPQAPAPSAEPSSGLRLDDRVAPVFERIALDLDPARSDYTGAAHFDLTVRRETDRFRFHAEGMEIRSLRLESADGEALPVRHAELPGAMVEVVAERPLAPGAYSLEVGFANQYGTRATGLYRTVVRDQPYLFTQLEAVDAREAFPCWDEPAYKIPFQLVLTVPAGLTAVTNTPLAARHAAGGRETLTFERTEPLPSYLLAIAVGPLETVEVPGMPVPGRIVVPQGQSALAAAAVEMTPPLLAALERWFGRPYPYAKLDLIAVPEFWPGAMENAGAITFADDVLLIDPAADTAEQRRRLARIAAHEMAHMWFGDLVTMRWWDDFWLNESFADWMGNKISDQVYPQYGIETSELAGVERQLKSDGRLTTRAVRQPVERPEEAMENVGLAYAKGRSVLGMVEAWLGPEVFRRGVVDYIGRHAGGNAVAADLWGALAEASGKEVEAVLASFLDQPGYPLIRVEPAGDGAVTLAQSRFLNAGVRAPAAVWTVPVGLRWADAAGEHNATVVLSEASRRVELPGAAGEIAWLLPNADARGYYRWQLPAERLQSLAGDAAEVLTPRERIDLLGDASSLLDAGVLGGGDYLRLLNRFADDPDPEVIAALLAGVGTVENAFVPDDLSAAFALWVRRTLGPALERFGRLPRPGEAETVALFRPRLLAWLGDEGRDPEVRGEASRMARRYLADPASLDPALAEVDLQLAALDGDEALFETYRRRFEETRIPEERGRFLAALGSFRDPVLQRRALDYTLTGPLRPDEMATIPFRVGDAPGGDDLMFDWLLANYDAFTARMIPDFVSFMPFAAGGCSADRLAEAREFFSRPEHQAPGTAVQLARVSEQVEGCLALRRREGAEVAAYLRGLAGGAAPGGS